MSNSFRKNPIMKIDKRTSGKEDKQIANRIFRRKYLDTTAVDLEDGTFLVNTEHDMKQFKHGSNWSWKSDGCRYFLDKDNKKDMTK